MNIIELFRVDFDNLENEIWEARHSKSLSIFFDDEKITAIKKIQSYLKNMGPVYPYLGHDEVVYPIFYTDRKKIVCPKGEQ